MTTAEALTSRMEDYLEAILVASEGDHAHVADLAREMGVSVPSASVATRELARRGLVTRRGREGVALTPRGRQAADRVARRHSGARAFLVDVLGVTSAKGDRLACLMEHEMDSGVLGQLVRAAKFSKSCPAGSLTPIGGADSPTCDAGRTLDKCRECLTTLAGRLGT